MSVIIRLQGLSWSASAMDIRNFFQGLSIPPGGVHIIGGENGDAFIAFTTDEDARQAMMMSSKLLNETPVQLFLSSKTEMQNTIVKAKEVSTPAVPIPQTSLPQQQTGGQSVQHNLFGVQGFSSIQLQQIAQHIGLTQGDINKQTPQMSVQQQQLPRDVEQPLPGEYALGGMQENTFNPNSQPLGQSSGQSYQQPSVQGRPVQPPHQQQFQGPSHTMHSENVSNNSVNKHWGAGLPPNSVPSSIIQNVSNLLQGHVGKHLDMIQNTLQLPKLTPTNEDVSRNETTRFVQPGTTKPSEPMTFDYQNRQRYPGGSDVSMHGRPTGTFNQDRPPFSERSHDQTSTRPPVMFNQERSLIPDRSEGQTSSRPPVIFNQDRPPFPERSDGHAPARPPAMFNQERPPFPARSDGQTHTRPPIMFNQERPPFSARSDGQTPTRPHVMFNQERPPFPERSDSQTASRPPVMFNQERPPFTPRSDGQTPTRPPIMFNQERPPFSARSEGQPPTRPPFMFTQERPPFSARSDGQPPTRHPVMFNRESPPSSESFDVPTSQRNHEMFNQERQTFSKASDLATPIRPPVMFNQGRSPFTDMSDRQTPPRFPFQGPFANLPPPNQRFPPNQTPPDSFSNVKPSLLGPGPGARNDHPPQEPKINQSQDDFGQSEMSSKTNERVAFEHMDTTQSESNSDATVQMRNKDDSLNKKMDVPNSKGVIEKGKKSDSRDSRSGRDRDRDRDRSREKDRDRDRSKHRDSPRYDRDRRDRDRSRGTDRDDDRRRRDRDRGRDRDRRDRKDDRHSRERNRDTDKKSSSPGSSRLSSKKRSLSPESKIKNEKDKKLQTNKTEPQPVKPVTSVSGGSPLSHSIALTLQQLEDAERKDTTEKKESMNEVTSNEVKNSSQDSEKKHESQNVKASSGEPRRRSRFETIEEVQGQGGNIVDTRLESGGEGNDRKNTVQIDRNSDLRHSDRNSDRSVNRDDRRDSRNVNRVDCNDGRGHSMMNREGNEISGPPSFNRQHGDGFDRSGFRSAENRSNVRDTGDNSEERGPRNRSDIRNPNDRSDFRGPENLTDFRSPEDRSGPRGQDKRSDFRRHEDGSDFSRGPVGRSNNRGPDNRADYRGPENRSEMISIENRPDFRGPSDAPNMRSYGNRQDYRGPENRPDYRGPGPRSDFRGSDNRRDFIDPDGQSDFRGPGDHPDFRGPGDNSDFRGHDNRTDFRSPEGPNHLRGPGDYPDFRRPSNPQEFIEPKDQSDFIGSCDYRDLRGRRDVPDFRGSRERDFRGPGARSDFRGPGNNPDFRGNPTDNREFDGQNRMPNQLIPDFPGQPGRFGPPLNGRDVDSMNGRRPALLANPSGFDFQGPRGRGGPPPRFGPPSRDSFRPPRMNETTAPRPDPRIIPDNPNIRPPNNFDRSARGPKNIERNNTSGDTRSNVKNATPGEKEKTECTSEEKSTVIVERLPLDANYKDIRKLFSGKEIPRDGIKIINDSKGDRTGTAYVRFVSSHVLKTALTLDKTRFKGNLIVIRPVQQKEYDEAVDLFVPDDSDDDSNDGSKKIELRNTLAATLRVLKGEEEKKMLAKAASRRDNIVRIEKLPMSATAYQVKELFKECTIRKEDEGILFKKDQKGCRTGVCYVEFADGDSFKKALNHKSVFKNAPISIFPVSKNERDDLMKQQSSNDKKKTVEKPTAEMRCIRIGNIPKDFAFNNVCHLLSGIEIATRGVTICHDAIGKPMGECYVELTSTKEVDKALSKDGLLIGSEHINIKPVTKEKMIENLRDLRLALQPEQPTQQAVFYFVKATHLPKGVTTGELINFFTGYRASPESIRLNVGDLSDKGESSTALIGFKQREDAEKAVDEKQGCQIRNRPVALAKVILGGQ